MTGGNGRVLGWICEERLRSCLAPMDWSPRPPRMGVLLEDGDLGVSLLAILAARSKASES